MQQGDDVAELQRRLGTLGFDPGRRGNGCSVLPRSAPSPVPVEHRPAARRIAGHESVALSTGSPRAGSSQGVSEVREREALRHAPTTLSGRRLALGEPGGLEVLIRATHRALALAGADVIVLQHPDGSALAAAANAADAELYLDLALDDERCHGEYYAATGFESAGGKRLATMLDELVPPVLANHGECPSGCGSRSFGRTPDARSPLRHRPAHGRNRRASRPRARREHGHHPLVPAAFKCLTAAGRGAPHVLMHCMGVAPFHTGCVQPCGY